MTRAKFYVVAEDGREYGPFPQGEADLRAREVAGSLGRATIEVETDSGNRVTYTTIDRP